MFGVTSKVSASGNQIYWGAFVGPHHIGYYDLLQTFETNVGKDVSIWNWFQLWNRPDDSENVAEFDTTLMTQCRNNGMIPMVSWAPEAGDGSTFVNLQSILSGTQDAYLRAWGNASAAWGHPYFVRLMWEFNGNWAYGVYPFGYGNTGAAEFVQAWQYIVNKIRASGGTQISWIWCPFPGDSQNTLASLYPGDAYVDWVATETYPSAGQSFDQSVQSTIGYVHNIAPNKPLMMAEVGYTGSDSVSWWTNLLSNVLPNEYPNIIKALVIWQDPLDSGITVTSSSSTLTAFQQGISSSYYSSNVYSDLNTSPIPPANSLPTPTITPTQTPHPTSTSTTPTPTSTSTFSPIDYYQQNILVVVVVITVSLTVVMYLYIKISHGKRKYKKR